MFASLATRRITCWSCIELVLLGYIIYNLSNATVKFLCSSMMWAYNVIYQFGWLVFYTSIVYSNCRCTIHLTSHGVTLFPDTSLLIYWCRTPPIWILLLMLVLMNTLRSNVLHPHTHSLMITSGNEAHSPKKTPILGPLVYKFDSIMTKIHQNRKPWNK